MNRLDLNYLKQFLDEVEALYEADDGDHIPEYIHDMILNLRQVLKEEKPTK